MPNRTRALLVLAASLVAVASGGCWHNASLESSPTFSAQSTVRSPVIKLVWRKTIHDSQDWDYRNQEFSAPALISRKDELVVGASDGHVSRVKASSGKTIWSRTLVNPEKGPLGADPERLGSPVHADVLVHDRLVFVGTLDGGVHALNYTDGTTRWSFKAEDAIESGLTYADGRLLFMDGREILYTLDATTGKLLWRYQRRAPEYFTIKGAGVPTVRNGVVYAGFADGALVALQLDTGELVWSRDLSADRTEFTDIDLQPIVDGDRIYVGSYASGLNIVALEDGLLEWRLPLDNLTAMIQHREILYLTTAQGRVVAVDPVQRKTLWSFRFKDANPVGLTAHGPYLFVATADGPLAVLDREVGTLLHRWNPSNGFHTPPVFDKARGFILSNGGILYSFEVGLR